MLTIQCQISPYINSFFKKGTSDKTIILIDTDNRMVVTRGEWGLEEYQQGKGGQIQGDRKIRLWIVSRQQSIQVLYYYSFIPEMYITLLTNVTAAYLL